MSAYYDRRPNPKEEPVRRRQFIAAAVAATGAGVLPATLSERAVAAPNRLDGSVTLPTVLNDLAADIYKLGADYVAPQSAPARADLYDLAAWHWAQAVVTTSRARRTPLRTAALSVEAEAARQLAMICADRRELATATKLYRQAQGAAMHADNHELTAWIRTSWAYMPLYTQNLARVDALTTTALEVLNKAHRPGGRAAVCAWALKARVYGAQGDRAGVSEALRQAYGAMGRYSDAGSVNLPNAHHPQRFAWVKLRLAAAEAFAALGDTDQHAKAYDQALADPFVSAMHRPMLNLGQAETTLDPAAAAHTALTVLKGMPHPPAPIVGRARALAARAHARAPRNENVQSLRVHLLTLAR